MAADKGVEESHPASSTLNQPRPVKMNLWARVFFQRIFIFSLTRLVVYLNKIYQDIGSTRKYYDEKEIYFSIVGLVSLVAPSLIYAIYLSFSESVKKSSPTCKDMTTKFLNGLLLIPWQIKRHLDGLYFGAQQVCSFRAGKMDELEHYSFLNRDAEVLEFFEDLYAGFLQVVLQVYIFSIHMDKADNDLFLPGELIGSMLSIFSMLVAIRRRDDGLLTGFLSFVGWIAMFASRVFVFAMASMVIGRYISVVALVHALFISVWVYRIAIESHTTALDSETEVDDVAPPRPVHQNKTKLFMLVFLFFGIPSLVLWPIMFQLKERKRPLWFLLIATVENAALLTLWYVFHKATSTTDQYLMLSVIGCTVLANLFISGYVCCKPSFTDEVVLYDMRFSQTESFGIYFEFCDVVFNLKVRKVFQQELEKIRQQVDNM